MQNGSYYSEYDEDLGANTERGRIPSSQEEPADSSREAGLQQEAPGQLLGLGHLARRVQLPSSATDCKHAFTVPQG